MTLLTKKWAKSEHPTILRGRHKQSHDQFFMPCSNSFSHLIKSATPLIISLTKVTSSFPMRSIFEMFTSSSTSDAKPPKPRACKFRSAHHFLKLGCFDASGILSIIDARRPVPKLDGQEHPCPYFSWISIFRPTLLHAASTACTNLTKRSKTPRML